MLPIYLSEPCNEPARRRAAATLSRQPLAAPLDLATLARDRQCAANRTEAFTAKFEAVLAARGVSVCRAATADAAAEHIATLAPSLPVAVTRSAVVGELQGALTARGVNIVPTYAPGNRNYVSRHQHFWQLPVHAPSVNWRTQPVEISSSPEPGRHQLAGLFGVNAASARTGTLYLLQHSTNISELLRTARRLIFVVAIDKIVEDDAAALRQSEAAGMYGADAVLLDLARTPPLGDAPDQLPVTEGAPAVEVIILDNGRSALLEGPYRSLFTCIACRACALRCPTYPEFRGARGWSPKDYLWSHLRGDNPALDLCTLCGNCEVDCPLDIPLPALIAQRRAEGIATRGRGLAGWRRRVHGEVERVAKLFSATAPLSNCAQRLPLAGTVMDNVLGLTAQRPLPAFRRDTFERWHAKHGRAARGRRAGVPRSRVVYYFGCFANYNNPEVGQATVAVLEALGYDVLLPDWRCCGIPLYAKGELAAARRMAAYNADALSAYVDAGCEIVTSCPSCHLALARDYPRLFPSPATEWVSTHTHFLSRFLLGGSQAEIPCDGRFGVMAQRAAYHLPCHLRALGMQQDSLRLLAQIPGLSLTNLERGCCGLSGTFGLERAHYAQSMEIGSGLFAAVKENTFDLVLTDCGACKLQIEHGTGRQVTHPVEVLWRALQMREAQAPAEPLPAARQEPRPPTDIHAGAAA